MGSHGGATAEGQLSVLESLGITEETVGCPIRSSMETVRIGETAEGIPVLIDAIAAAADGIVVINRIKAHTEYTGPVESGWMKMLAIGLGKHQGALTAHRNAVQFTYRTAIVSVAREIIRRAPLLFGLGLVENAYDQTAEVVAAGRKTSKRPRSAAAASQGADAAPALRQAGHPDRRRDRQGDQRLRHGPQRHRPAHGLWRGRARRHRPSSASSFAT